MTTVTVTKEVYQLLLEYAGLLQQKTKQKISINDAILNLFEQSGLKLMIDEIKEGN